MAVCRLDTRGLHVQPLPHTLTHSVAGLILDVIRREKPADHRTALCPIPALYAPSSSCVCMTDYCPGLRHCHAEADQESPSGGHCLLLGCVLRSGFISRPLPSSASSTETIAGSQARPANECVQIFFSVCELLITQVSELT